MTAMPTTLAPRKTVPTQRPWVSSASSGNDGLNVRIGLPVTRRQRPGLADIAAAAETAVMRLGILADAEHTTVDLLTVQVNITMGWNRVNVTATANRGSKS